VTVVSLAAWRRRVAGLLVPALLLAACSERLAWREVRSPDGYSVLLPGRAQTVQRDVELDGQRLAVSMTSTGVGATLFAVGVVQLPAGWGSDAAARERVLAYFRDALVRNIAGAGAVRSGAVLAAPPGQRLRAAEAVEARGKGGDGRPAQLVARFFIVDDRLYEVIALGGEGTLDALALDTYFTSFRLTP
jgi:hypothetical protein